MWFFRSESTNPYFNLALEEYLFTHLNEGEELFMLWQNSSCVVLGQYQNAQAEIAAEYVRRENVKVVRRMSGGGAVYHDLGNLNFTFISRGSGDLDFSKFCRPVMDTLERLGAKAELSGRNDMTLQGKKFSGSSQYSRGGKVLHHGTLMFDSDLAAVEKALNVGADKIRSKGVASVSSRVTNILPHLQQPVSLEEFEMLLTATVAESHELRPLELSESQLKEILRLQQEKYSTWQWNFGRCSQCSIRKKRRIPLCGEVEVAMELDAQGKIAQLDFSGDFFAGEDFDRLEETLIGADCRKDALLQRLSGLDISRCIHNAEAEDIADIITM